MLPTRISSGRPHWPISFFERAAQHFRGRNALDARKQPIGDDRVPGIGPLAPRLFGFGVFGQVLVQPAFFAVAITFAGLSPELVAVPLERFDVDFAADDGPVAAQAGFVSAIIASVHRAGEDALAGVFLWPPGVRRAIAIDGSRKKTLDARGLGAVERVKLAELDNPDAGEGERRVFRGQVRYVVGEKRAGESFNQAAFCLCLEGLRKSACDRPSSRASSRAPRRSPAI
jgi:hypothetical protein